MEAIQAMWKTLQEQPWLAVLALVVVAMLSLWIGLAIGRWRAAERMNTSRVRGRYAEAQALNLLAAHGFELIESQPSAHSVVFVDGESTRFLVRADALVERDGRRGLVEIKAGGRVATVASAATRRQLLEYAHAFDVDDLLLVDSEAETIARIAFPLVRS